MRKYKNRASFVLLAFVFALQSRSPFMYEYFADIFLEKFYMNAKVYHSGIMLAILFGSPLIFLFYFINTKFAVRNLVCVSTLVSGIFYFLLPQISSGIVVSLIYLALLAINYCILFPSFLKCVYMWSSKDRHGAVLGVCELVRVVIGYICSYICINYFNESSIFYGVLLVLCSLLSFLVISKKEEKDFVEVNNNSVLSSPKNSKTKIILVVLASIFSGIVVSFMYCLSMFNSNIAVFFSAGNDLSNILKQFSHYITPVIAALFGGIIWDGISSKHFYIITAISFVLVMTVIQLCLPIQSSYLPIVLITYSISTLAVSCLKVILPALSFYYTSNIKDLCKMICCSVFSISIFAVLTPMFIYFINGKYGGEVAYRLTFQLVLVLSLIGYICMVLFKHFMDKLKLPDHRLSEKKKRLSKGDKLSHVKYM